MPEIFSFPQGFLWGASTSAYQIEGGNFNNDWFAWEAEGKVPYSCGGSADSYRLFDEDFRIAKQLGHNCHRLSFEWSRIEPDKGRFDSKQIEHYFNIIASLKAKNILPIVTLHHFTSPAWFTNKGGWFNSDALKEFSEYADLIAKEFSDVVEFWTPLNEPAVYAYNGYFKGIWPPGYKSLGKTVKLLYLLEQAHIRAYRSIHRYNKTAKVGIAKHLRGFYSCPKFNFGQNFLPVYLRNKIFNFSFLNSLVKNKTLDFIGVNYYSLDFVRFSFTHIFGNDCLNCCKASSLRKNNLGWYVNSQAMLEMLLKLRYYRMPVIITENGTSDIDDKYYKGYLLSHLTAVAKAIKEGVDIRGYLWWSLIDNFEWDKGFSPRFGLAGVDSDKKRVIKPFAYTYRDICGENRIEINITK